MSNNINPLFVFARRGDIEREYGFALAGQLVIDTREGEERPPNAWTAYVIGSLLRASRTMPGDWVAIGWRDESERRDLSDAELGIWAQDRLTICVRVDRTPRSDGKILLDRDVIRQALGNGEGQPS